MIPISGAEQQKWDEYYANLPVLPEDELTRAINLEFAEKISGLLPKGGKTLEAGCGGGWQSLALARLGTFQVSLMDFSSEALKYSQKIFQQADVRAEWLQGDATLPGEPLYDLVFNAGVLEHYTFDEQANFIQSMASRSKHYVLVLLPNRLCYWYWIWRIQTAKENEWPYGKEVPLMDLSSAFQAGGVHFIGQTFLGSVWTEAFIQNIQGMDDSLRQHILSVHRAHILDKSHTSYLLAALGSVQPESNLPGWDAPLHFETQQTAELYSSLADALALNMQSANLIDRKEKLLTTYAQELDEKKTIIFQQENRFLEKMQEIEQQHTQLEQQEQRLIEQKQRLTEQEQRFLEQQQKLFEQEQTLQREKEIRTAHEIRLAQMADEIDQLEEQKNALSEENSRKEEDNQQQIHILQSNLNEIYSSRAWKLVQKAWHIRTSVAPRNSLRERILGLGRTRRTSNTRPPKKVFPPMNAYAYAFVRYKRAREDTFAKSLNNLEIAHLPGLVSIVLPVYNGAEMVSESLESILQQTYPNFEVIAINDGSTDQTAAILDSFAERDKRIRVIHQENRKLPRSLSRGFREARGEFLTWTSHDNRMKPEFLERMVGTLRDHPDWDMTYANLEIIGEDGKALTHSEWYQGYQVPPGSPSIHFPENIAELNTYPNNYIGAAFLYRSRTAWLLGDYSKIRFTAEDYDYWMQVNDLLTLRHTPFKDPIYEYRFHSQSLTAKDKELRITENRVKLMAFETFRRDFYLSSMAWVVENEPGLQSTAARLRQELAHKGQMLVEQAQLEPDRLPKLWHPVVYLYLTSQPCDLPPMPANIPHNSLRVLVVIGDKALPEQVPPDWGLCLHLGGYPRPLPRLPQDYQGWLNAADIATLIQAVDIRARSDHLKLIENAIDNAPRTYPFKASVIICTFRGGERVLNTIDGLLAQTADPDSFEILVVNNDPADASLPARIDEVRAKHFSRHPERLRLVNCHLKGLSHARNAGISEAHSEVVCFLDDDAVPQKDWLEEMIKAFDAHPETSLIGGHIRLRIPKPRPKALLPGCEGYWSHFITGFQEYTEVQNWWEFPWGANWCARRQALLEIGGFRTQYGRVGKNFNGGEEIVAARGIQSLGYKIAILPQAEVLHCVDEGRFTFNHVRRTLTAARMVNYQMQVDLYLPVDNSFGQTWREIKTLLARKEQDPDKEIIRKYTLEALWTLLKQQFKDALNRRK